MDKATIERLGDELYAALRAQAVLALLRICCARRRPTLRLGSGRTPSRRSRAVQSSSTT